MQIIYKGNTDWLEKRNKVGGSIGSSEVSAIVGMNPYKTNIDLWEEKVGLKKPIDISDKPFVKYGHDAEPLLVKLFEIDYPQYEVNYNDNFRVNYNDDYPYMACTRDCDLIEKDTGKKGALEIKTSKLVNPMSRKKWDNQIPANYYCQVLQYFITDVEIEFVWLKAQLKSEANDGKLYIQTKHYYFTREQCKEDIEWLMAREIEFWDCVTTKTKPNLVLPSIL